MSKHTPGPWKAVPVFVTSHMDVFEIAEVSNMRIIPDGANLWPAHGTPEDDARLIASAPDLLSVSMMVMVWRGKHEYDCIGDRNVFDFEPDFVTAACAAIAKATGAPAPATNPEAAAAFDKMMGSPKFPSVRGVQP